jgi:short-subunit dehydrogenase
MHYDLKSYGTRVTALCPGFFASEFFERAGHRESYMMKLLMLDSGRVARAGIRGTLRGRMVVIPSLRYKVMALCLRFLPRSVGMWAADFTVRF